MKVNWVKLFAKPPAERERCWVWNGRGVGITTFFGGVFLGWDGVTHWSPYSDPEPPED